MNLIPGFYKMGVLNVTPNSFSDGGQYLKETHIKERLDYFIQHNFDWIDIGAESTAPFNHPIGKEEEQSRLEVVLPLLDQIPHPIRISLDTYRSETFLWFQSKTSKKIVWNDVSGKLDKEWNSVIEVYPDLEYVFCDNRAPSRELSSKHLDYISDELEMNSFFAKGTQQSLSLILDPCFGFSKNRAQNLKLMDQMSEYISQYPQRKWVLGISRKSFLRSAEANEKLGLKKYEEADQVLREWILSFQKQSLYSELIFRIHDQQQWPF